MKRIEYPNGKPKTEELLNDGSKKILLEDFVVHNVDRGNIWRVPAGYISDGKSVPPALEPFIGDPFEGVTEEGAWVHDFECEYAAFYLDERNEFIKQQEYENYQVLKTQYNAKRPYRSQQQVHRAFREITEFEMKNFKEYKWFSLLPHKLKLWQYSRAKIMWAAVRGWNFFKNPKWQ